jgi:uridine phosphorylase
MAGVYNFAAACLCGVVAQRTVGENVILEQKDVAVKNAIAVAVRAAEIFE